MGVLSSTNVLYFRIALLFTISFFCFKNVNSILENSYFLVLTQAMNLPALTLSPKMAQLGLFGFLFALLAIDDLIPLLEKNSKHFASLVPFRLMVFFIITAYSYMAESNYYVHNNGVFIYSFMEVWLNFLIFSAIREERNNEFAQSHQFMDESALTEVDENRGFAPHSDGEEGEEEEMPLTTAQELEIEDLKSEEN